MLLGLIISTYLRNLLLQITAAIAASAARERSVYIHTGDLSAVLAAVLSAVFPVEDFVFVTFLLAVSVVVWLGFWFCPGLSMPGVFGSSGLPGFGLSGFSGSGFSGSGFSGFGFSGSSLAWIV